MNTEEISLANPALSHPQFSTEYAQSTSDQLQKETESVNEIFQEINATHVTSLKTALKSIYPFVPSINHTEYYFIHLPVICLNEETLGIFALTVKTFSNKLLQDPSEISALAYELEIMLKHKSGLALKNDFSSLLAEQQPGLQAINITNVSQVDSAEIKMSGTSNDVNVAKDMLYAYFEGGFEGELFSVQQRLHLPGQWTYQWKIRGHLICQGQFYVALGFNYTNLMKLNANLKISEQVLLQKIEGSELKVEALANGGISMGIIPFEFKAEFKRRDVIEAEIEKNTKNDDEDFSCEETQEVENVKQNFLTKLFTKQEANDQFVLEVNKQNLCRINPAFKQIQREDIQPAIQQYNNQDLKDGALTMCGFEFSGGESLFCCEGYDVKVGSKYQSQTIKIVMTSRKMDVYLNGEFEASVDSGEMYVKLMEKGSQCEVIEIDM